MMPLLESALTLIGIALMLALAAERLQELVKAAVALKSSVRVAGVRRLVVEAAGAAGFSHEQGNVVVDRVFARLRALNQRGLRHRALRLDHLTKDHLKKLVRGIDHQTVAALHAVAPEVAQQRLDKVVEKIEEWYDLALEPVDDRHGRRMRLGALGAAFVVVVVVNADGLALMRRSWSDAAFRDSVAARLGPVLEADSTFRTSIARRDSLRADTAAAAAAARGVADSTLRTAFERRNRQLDSALAAADLALFSYPAGFRITPRWILGILLSTLLVSLGAPFWHDLLASVTGLKEKAQRLVARDRPTARNGLP